MLARPIWMRRDEELRRAIKKVVVELAASAVITIGTIAAATIAGSATPTDDDPPAIRVPLCVGYNETPVGPDGKVAKIASLHRCAALQP